MPVEIQNTQMAPANTGAFSLAPDNLLLHVVLWPHRSMTRVGFAWVLLLTWLGFLIPLMAFLGTLALWALLPFTLTALAALWWMIERNYKDGDLHEEVWITRDLIRVERHERRKDMRDWQANPFWTRVQLHGDAGPVPSYLTLIGAGREIELGTFLTPEERIDLHDTVQAALTHAKLPAHQN